MFRFLRFPDFHDEKRHFFIAIGTYLFCGIFLFPRYLSNINPDIINYLSIARTYRESIFAAVSIYWSPLFSWLLAPLLFLSDDGMLLARILLFCFGFLLFFAVRFLSQHFSIIDPVRSLMWYALIPITLSFVFLDATPDLLFLCFLLFYLGILFHPIAHRTTKMMIGAGVLGAGAYYTKSIALPLFISHMFVIHVVDYWMDRTSRLQIIRGAGWGLITFVIVISPWITAVSLKYGSFSFGNAGSIIFQSKGPEEKNLNMDRYGLVPPPHAHAFSIWDAPETIQMVSWSPVESWSSFVYFLKHLARNGVEILWSFIHFSVFSFAILLFSLPFLLWRKEEDNRNNRIALLSLMTIILIVAAYLPIVISDRYFWAPCILLLLLGAQLCSLLVSLLRFSRIQSCILLSAFFLSFAGWPVGTLLLQYGRGEDLRSWSRQFMDMHPVVGSTMASDLWKTGFVIAHYVDGRYYGQPLHEGNASLAEAELLNHNIRYYIVFGELEGSFVSYREILVPNFGKTSPRVFEQVP